MKVCEALGSLPQAGGDRDSLRYDVNNVEWIAEPTTISLTTAEYEALENDGDLVPQTSYILTDAPALEYTANDLSYDGTATTTKQKIDANASNITTLQNKVNALLPPAQDYPNGTASTAVISDYISTYGANTMMFAFVITGLGWFECNLTFYNSTQGGGFLVFNGGTPRLWAVSYQNGTVSLAEK
jgi:hypothetical protein